jgi:hypothetical protein
MTTFEETEVERLDRELAYKGKPDRLKMAPGIQDLTLDQVMERDADNFNLVMKECKRYRAKNEQEASLFFVEAYRTGLSKLGVTAIDKLRDAIKASGGRKQVNTAFYEKLCAKQEADKGIICQRRKYNLTEQMQRALEDTRLRESAASAAGMRTEAKQFAEQCERILLAIKNLHNAQHDFRRTGLYIYYQDEIAYFVGEPIIQNASAQGGVIIPGRKEIFVWTNVPMDASPS